MGFQPLAPALGLRGTIVSVPVVDDDPIRDWIYYSQLLPPSERCHLPKLRSQTKSKSAPWPVPPSSPLEKALPRAPPPYSSASLRRDVGGELGDAKERSNIPGRVRPGKAERLDEYGMVHGKGCWKKQVGHFEDEDEDKDKDDGDDEHEFEK